MLKTGNRYPYNQALKERAIYLRRNMTLPEQKLWYDFFQKLPLNPPHLRGKTSEASRGRKLRVYRQRPIHNFIVDFYIPKYKLVIEIDGESHFSELGKIYDRERSNVLSGMGISILRYTNIEVMKNFEGVCIDILTHLSIDKR